MAIYRRRLVELLNVPSTDFRMTNGVTAFEIDDDNVMWLSPYYEKGLVKIVIEMPGRIFSNFQVDRTQIIQIIYALSNWIEIVIYGSEQRMVDYIVMIVNTI